MLAWQRLDRPLAVHRDPFGVFAHGLDAVNPSGRAAVVMRCFSIVEVRSELTRFTLRLVVLYP
jgi:hypothetical protein